MIETAAKQLFTDLNRFFSQTKPSGETSDSQLKALLEASLRRLNLVSREEFDIQQAVLLRTRTKLEALEAQVKSLENEVRGAAPSDSNSPDNAA